MFDTMGYSRGFVCCDMLLGDLNLREGELAIAEQLFKKCNLLRERMVKS
jgi:hypothetical protein